VVDPEFVLVFDKLNPNLLQNIILFPGIFHLIIFIYSMLSLSAKFFIILPHRLKRVFVAGKTRFWSFLVVFFKLGFSVASDVGILAY